MSDTSPAALLTQLDEISAQIEELSSDLLARRRNEVRTRLTQVIGRLRETEARRKRRSTSARPTLRMAPRQHQSSRASGSTGVCRTMRAASVMRPT